MSGFFQRLPQKTAPRANAEPAAPAPADPIATQLELFQSAVLKIQEILTALATALAELGNNVPQQQAAHNLARFQATLRRLAGK